MLAYLPTPSFAQAWQAKGVCTACQATSRSFCFIMPLPIADIFVW